MGPTLEPVRERESISSGTTGANLLPLYTRSRENLVSPVLNLVKDQQGSIGGAEDGRNYPWVRCRPGTHTGRRPRLSDRHKGRWDGPPVSVGKPVGGRDVRGRKGLQRRG